MPKRDQLDQNQQLLHFYSFINDLRKFENGKSLQSYCIVEQEQFSIHQVF